MPTSFIPLPVSRQSLSSTPDFYFDEQPMIAQRRNSGTRMPKPIRTQQLPQQPQQHHHHALPEPLIPSKPSPKSSTEWKRTVAEVKRDYINRKYRACYTRCNEIVESTKHLKVETAYIIYVRFYAASAIEMQVRSLHQSSPYRTKLLLQAREHYRAASDLAAEEDNSMRRPSSRSFSPIPSLHSPSGSDGGRSMASTRMSSPSPSLSSLDSCLKSHDSVPKPKKRVAFIDAPSYEPADVYEPVIRPDSPTLGFDDWFSRPSSPEPVVAAPGPRRMDNKSLSAIPLPSPTLSTTSTDSSSDEEEDDDELLVDCFSRQRSVHHYCTILNSLQRQISSHLSWLDQDITAALAPQSPTITTEEMRALELRTRIERLRASGWKRQRFNPQRYEALRESALADMN
ncbi:hypothetical protein PT974_08582 [Cladobotryum mycophilum]|uniref:Uncharacterized protein n=1 Tax=Cladobotryum mycophilum TaxID=491253 RepID=A0ABR0SET8_9HYPO